MSEQTVEKTSGSGQVVNPTSGVIEGAPAAHSSSDSPIRTHINWHEDPRPTSNDDATRSLDPYWKISVYTEEEFNAYLDDDELTPELVERYKDLLED